MDKILDMTGLNDSKPQPKRRRGRPRKSVPVNKNKTSSVAVPYSYLNDSMKFHIKMDILDIFIQHIRYIGYGGGTGRY